MASRIHDDEVDTSEATVRALLRDQCPTWADAPLIHLATTGTTNRLWRVRTPSDLSDAVIRLPRQVSAAAAIERELDLLPRLGAASLAELVALPTVAHAGRPTDGFTLPWMACWWLDGDDLWTRRRASSVDTTLAESLALAIREIRILPSGVPLPARVAGQRGGPLAPVLERIAAWLDEPQWNAPSLVDVDRVRATLRAARSHLNDEYEPTGLHGDLLPGNLLVDADGQLSAIIDWGGAGVGDPAEDLAPAWSVFDEPARSVFRAALDADDATWARAKAIELEHSLGGLLYYRPRRHPLGDVMARTLQRILDDGR